MWILPALGYLGIILGFGFLTLAIASGLYYLSELVEEHTVFAKKSLSRLIYSVIVVQLLLCFFDGFPLFLSAFSIASHGVYLVNLRRFPIVKLSDPIFLTSCVLVLVNHYLWFRHFSKTPSYSTQSSSHPYRHLTSYDDPFETHASFTEVASFFGLCVWFVPFALFVSLSASENVLPSMGSEYATGEGSSFVRSGKEPGMNGGIGGGINGRISGGMNGRLTSLGRGHNAGLAKAMVDGVRGWVGQTGQLMGFFKPGAQRPRHESF